MDILLIEDERPLAVAIARILNQAGMRVWWEPDGEAGFNSALADRYDLIILDILLPHMSGWEICRELRANRVATQILILSAMDEPGDRVRGLDLGADDYLTKPFEPEELLARVRARLRQDETHRGPTIRVGDMEIDRAAHRVWRSGQEIALTMTEFRLLETLAAHEGRPLDERALSGHTSFSADPLADALDVSLETLRHKLDEPYDSPLIRHTAEGYVLGVWSA